MHSTDVFHNSRKKFDVLDNLITINGHGTFNPEMIEVPEWCQIMIPHRDGLNTPYTTPDDGKDVLFEQQLYENRYFNYNSGWKLYLPGDKINNLIISPFDDASNCFAIQESHELQTSLISKCNMNGQFNKFCPLYCTKKLISLFGNKYEYVLYNGKRKLKIKSCSRYSLHDLLDNLQSMLSKILYNERDHISPSKEEPIVLVPFTCNALPEGPNQQLGFS